jgi:predicted DNA-binding transcriptional regulator AlpA
MGQEPMETHSMNEKLLNEAEVAKWLGYSPRTVQGWRLRGKGPAHVVIAGKTIRYRVSDVQSWLDRQTEKEKA